MGAIPLHCLERWFTPPAFERATLAASEKACAITSARRGRRHPEGVPVAKAPRWLFDDVPPMRAHALVTNREMGMRAKRIDSLNQARIHHDVG